MNLPSLQELNKSIYTESYYHFFVDAVKVLEPETDWDFNWHIEYICDILQNEVFRIRDKKPKTKDILVNVPPGSSKSSIFSVCLTAWAWIHCPYLRIASNSFNMALSTDHTKKSRDLILTPWYQELFGDLYKLKYDNNRTTEFGNDRGGIRKSAAETGRHFDIIIGDDLLNPKLASSEIERINANDLWFKTIPSRFKSLKMGLKIVVMQRLHENDVCGEILSRNLKYNKIVIPAELNDNLLPKELAAKYQDNLFWPERYPIEILDEKKSELGSKEYANQYLQQPSPEDGIYIKKEWLQERFNQSDLPSGIVRHFMSDTAYGKDNNSDYNATLCYSEYQNQLYIWSYFRQKLPFDKYIPAHKAYLYANSYDYKSTDEFEPKATGVSVVQVLKNETINAIMGPNPVDSKLVRLQAQLGFMQALKMKFLNGVSWEILEHEATGFPTAKNDDLVDCLVNCCQKVNKPKKQAFGIYISK